VNVLAIFGPTAAGKTSVAIAVAELLRKRGEDPVAISCDAIQVYRGLEALSGAPTEAEQARLEHRLVGVAEVTEEFSAGRYAELAHAEIDSLLADGRRPIVVGGTGLYLRAALADLDLRPQLPSEIRAEVEHELAEKGPAALHASLEPAVAANVHPNDGKRIARLAGLARAGIDPPRGSDALWTEETRRPTTLVGLVLDRDELRARIDARVDAIAAAGAQAEAEAAVEAGASRTARAALGFDAIREGDIDGMKGAQRAYARRQLTWMRKMRGVTLVDRGGRDDDEIAREIVALILRSDALT
jgi:tRNA dimethylallyltransferase